MSTFAIKIGGQLDGANLPQTGEASNPQEG